MQQTRLYVRFEVRDRARHLRGGRVDFLRDRSKTAGFDNAHEQAHVFEHVHWIGFGRVGGEASAALASGGERNAAANHVESITGPGNRQESGHRGRGSGMTGDSVARIVRRCRQFCACVRPPGFHPMKGFRKTRASYACNVLMRCDNLYHNTI
jgi:hypothetical protein